MYSNLSRPFYPSLTSQFHQCRITPPPSDNAVAMPESHRNKDLQLNVVVQETDLFAGFKCGESNVRTAIAAESI
jgi:hypothetical protein